MVFEYNLSKNLYLFYNLRDKCFHGVMDYDCVLVSSKLKLIKVITK